MRHFTSSKRLSSLVLWGSLLLFAARPVAAQTCTGFVDQSFTTAGTFSYTIPSNQASYFVRITARGADGGNIDSNSIAGGAGAAIVASFELLADEVLDVYVGAPGATGFGGGGGGGGSAVILDDTHVLVAAGAGGGSSWLGTGGGGGQANTNSAPGGGGDSPGGAGGGGFNAAGQDDTSLVTGGGAGTQRGARRRG